MEYLRKKEDSSNTVYQQVDSKFRERYDAIIGKLTIETFLADIAQAAESFTTNLPFVVRAVDRQSNRQLLTELEVDTYTAEQFFLYGVEGIPRFLMRNDPAGSLREMDGDELSDIDFGIDLSTYLSYNELFTCLQESFGGNDPSVALIQVLNMVCARMKLDAALIGAVDTGLTVHEVALLAGMKEKSVRNLAHKEIGAQHNEALGLTVIPALKAAEWLKGRRKYVPTIELKTQAAKDKLIELQDEFFPTC